MKSLAARMLEAADTLIEVSKVYQAFDPPEYLWSATRLRDESAYVEAREDV